MKSVILILLLVAVTQPGRTQVLIYGDNPSSCLADFTANTDPLDPMVIHFQDKSSGQITHWQWSFGDGVTSTIQSPTHIYTAGGTYFVCLTVFNSDSGSICHDVLCMPITIHEPGKCVADYIYSADSLNRLRIHFLDKSSGNINSWHWDFGDGTASDERNPTHTYSGFGKFRVCLTAYNADSMAVCQDVKCDSINIIPAPVCHASFTAALDSLNHAQNTFKFINRSTGDPTSYLWSFDDGATYSSRNVTHQFLIDGDHEVCLFITREEPGGIVCKDSLCQIITTAKYFNLGGHMFTGAFPINNPVSTGDTGIAYLFRKNDNMLIPFDTVRFTHLGYYAFPNVLNGNYILRATLTPGSAQYSKYFPAYFPQELKWKEGSILQLSDTSSFTSHIHLLPVNEALSGPGMINGQVVAALAESNSDGIPFAEVILYDAQLKPLTFAISGESGQFELNNLPYGAYNLYVDYPGKYSRLMAVWLDAIKPVADSLRLDIFEYDVTGIPDVIGTAIVSTDLFPNPVSNVVNLIVHPETATLLKFEILTITGLTMYSESRVCQAGSNLITLPVSNIPAGIYLFAIKSIQGSVLGIKKMVK